MRLRRASETNNLTKNPSSSSQARERALLVHIRLRDSLAQEDLEELRLLTESAGAEVCEIVQGARQKPDPATYVGKGKAEEIRQAVVQKRAGLVVRSEERRVGKECR